MLKLVFKSSRCVLDHVYHDEQQRSVFVRTPDQPIHSPELSWLVVMELTNTHDLRQALVAGQRVKLYSEHGFVGHVTFMERWSHDCVVIYYR